MIIVLSIALAAACIGSLAACTPQASGTEDATASATAPTTVPATISTTLPKPDMAKWNYLADGDVYYQAGLVYCEPPADEHYENLSVFVPAAYMNATKNSDGTYTCTLNTTAQHNGYTAANAPIVMPINTPGYYAAEPLPESVIAQQAGVAEYITAYTDQGFVFVDAGCRGLEEGAPAGVTDLKAAIRYIRYCDDVLAGDAESIFVYGMSGGGAQAAILGAAGNSALYEPYLQKIGAVQGVSDAVAGSMDWCPIISLDTADAEYEWMMGCARQGLSDEDKTVSDKLAQAYADDVNSTGFTDKNGNALTLTASAEGIYQAGSYYDYLKGVIETSLNHYLSDTKFDDPNLHNSYGSAENYVNALNQDGAWVTFDKSTNTAAITSVADFVKHCKPVSANPIAFDSPNSGNTLFGFGDGKGAHYDKILADILAEVHSDHAAAYAADFAKTDVCGYTTEQRVNMYSPLYYLMKSRAGFGTSAVAKYWRIRTGIAQVTTSVTTEMNLALALESYDGVESVDFETVWEQNHTEAERTGDSTQNFIAWVNTCVKG